MIQSQLYSDIERISGNEIFIRYLFLNEAFENSVGTQRADMGVWRKFALNLVTCAVPNLIGFDLVMVHPKNMGN